MIGQQFEHRLLFHGSVREAARVEYDLGTIHSRTSPDTFSITCRPETDIYATSVSSF